MRRKPAVFVLAATTMAISAGFAVNANATPSNGSMTGTGHLVLCVSEGRGYIVADGPDFVRTSTLNDGCAAPIEVEAGTYHLTADKYIDAVCWQGSPRVKNSIGTQGRCHGKVHHAHYGRYTPTDPAQPASKPKKLELTTVDVPGYLVANVAANRTTEVRMHVTDVDYPECLSAHEGRSCKQHPVMGPEVGR